MKNEQLDSISDEVAAAMTAGEPRPGFTARVMARIESDIESDIESNDAPRRTWRAAWVLASLAAAAAIVLAFVVTRGVHRSGDTAQPQASTSAARGVQPIERGADASAPRKSAGVAQDTPRTALATPVAPRGTRTHAIGEATRGAASSIVPLVAPSLDVAPLVVDSLTPDPIHVEQLGAITPITIAPLEIADAPKER